MVQTGELSNAQGQVMLQEDTQAMADLLARLGDEMDAAEGDDYAAGKTDGLEYAKYASYAEFRKYERIAADLDEAGTWDFWSYLDQHLLLPEDAQENLAELIQEEAVVDTRVYRQGWLDGMITVWYEVKQRL